MVRPRLIEDIETSSFSAMAATPTGFRCLPRKVTCQRLMLVDGMSVLIWYGPPSLRRGPWSGTKARIRGFLQAGGLDEDCDVAAWRRSIKRPIGRLPELKSKPPSCSTSASWFLRLPGSLTEAMVRVGL